MHKPDLWCILRTKQLDMNSRPRNQQNCMHKQLVPVATLILLYAIGAAADDRADAIQALASHGVKEVIFAVRKNGGERHYYANYGYYSPGPNRPVFHKEGGKLCKLDLTSGKVINLIDDPAGAVRDPQVHYDGQKILFAYRKGGEGQYHLYEINVDGSNLTQLTDGVYDDLEPTYTPDGGIIFVSTRGKRWVNCWNSQVGVLFRCDGDGRNLRCLSANVEHDNTPWMLPDGRVLYTRWEYVDRSQGQWHHLWTMNPDGSNQAVFYGNQRPHTGTYIDAKPIPGSDLIVMSDAGHMSSDHHGYLTTVSDKFGTEDRRAMKRLHKERIRDPYALSESCFLAVKNRGDELVMMDNTGRMITLFQTPGLHEPRPLMKRPREKLIAPRVNLKESTGTLILNSAHAGRNMKGVKKGDIKKLLIMESLPKPINYGGDSLDFVPLSWGGTFTLERILGTVPVEEDGSAHFQVPANRALIFIALDEKDVTVKRMHSFVTVAPGETLSCIGCHENRGEAPTNINTGLLQAVRRPASAIAPVPDVPDVIDYARHIQPIWDRHCVQCHNPDKFSGRVDLSNDYGIVFFMSFFELFNQGLISDNRNRSGNTPPRSVGDVKSRIFDYVKGSHHKAKLSPAEIRMLRNWIHIGAPQTGTYAALGTGMIADRYSTRRRITGEMVSGMKEADDVLNRRCAECHYAKNQKGKRHGIPTIHTNSNFRGGRTGQKSSFFPHLLYNLKRPDKSRILKASLAAKAGGWKIKNKDGKTIAHDIFANTQDPDYQTLLKMIESAKAYIDKDKRWHMDGFKPNSDYVREMKRYGILPESFDMKKDPIDVFATDRRYWEMLWYYPPGKAPELHKNESFKAGLKQFTHKPAPVPEKTGSAGKKAKSLGIQARGYFVEQESMLQAFDGNPKTKWLDPSDTTWISRRFGTKKVFKSYRLVSANDCPERDPRDWKLEGSNDGKTWSVIDTRAGEQFAGRYESRSFVLKQPAAYTHYRLSISANRKKNGMTQLADIIFVE